jgi:hypothetical protein
MNINDISRRELLKFYAAMTQELGVKFVGDPGLLHRLVKLAYDRITSKLAFTVPEEVFELRPMCLKNIIFLPYVPGADNVSPLQQIEIAIHEAAHALRIRDYPGRVSNWYGQYFTNSNFRALEECSAQLAEAEFNYWLDEKVDKLNLEKYALMKSSIDLAQYDYDQHIRRLIKHGQGFASSKSAATAIKFFKSI